MKYWLPKQTHEGLQVFAEKTLLNYKKDIIKIITKGKDGRVLGNLNDDYPLFLSLSEAVFTTKIIEVIKDFSPEGVSTRQISLELENGVENRDWHEVTVSSYVDCIDFKLSELDLDENDGSIDFIDKLVLDFKKADQAGYDIFRLHDYFPQVVVSDRLKQAIESESPVGIRFDPTDGSE